MVSFCGEFSPPGDQKKKVGESNKGIPENFLNRHISREKIRSRHKKIQQQLVAIRFRVNGPISLVEILISGCIAARVVFVCLLLPQIQD
jgi:hypothetical protein